MLSSIEDLRTCVPKMLAVVRLALKLKEEGTHYLWGAQGDGAPNMLVPDRPGPGDTKTFMRCATLYLGNPASGVCAGRFGAPEVARLPKWDPKARPTPGMVYRWPRYFKDISTDASPKVKEGVVWGEDCNGKKHFDCAGFVRYCFRQVLGQNIIPQTGMRSVSDLVWSADKPGSVRGIGDVQVWPADLLFDAQFVHVGIATGHWLLTGFGVTEPGQVIHCYSATTGVIMTPISDLQPVNWRHVYRWRNWS